MDRSGTTYSFRSASAVPSVNKNEYTLPLAVTRLRLVDAPAFAGFT